ncbi:MAG TPA: glycosyltransferase [Chitinophagales bacterium]|nr:glycosyltransferase [Chitinophagales bacterium]
MSEKIICTVTNDLIYDQRMQRICTSLQKNNFEVELVGRILPDSKEIIQQTFQQKRLKCFFNKGFLFYAEFNIRLLFFLLFTKFDIVCGCDLDTLPAALLAAKIKRKKVVYDAHEYFPESPELIGKPFKQSVWKFLEKMFVSKTDAIYTVTDSIARIFNKKYKVDCKLIRNVPLRNNSTSDMLQPVPNPIQDSTFLLYQGAVNLGRGLNEMLLAMLKIENIKFYIAGDGDEMENIRYKIKELKLGNKVKLLGKKTPEELKQITQQAYIGINLLENRGLSYYYSLGNKTFDYIHAAVPQVVIGFPEYIELNNKYNIGVVVEDLSVLNVYAAIQKLLEDKDLYQQLQQNCLKAREELCWENEEQKLINIYEQLTINN